MARIKLSFPDNAFYFETKMPVRITDINGANHLGNDALISMLSEARAQFLVNYGVEEADKNGVGIIVTDLATMDPVPYNHLTLPTIDSAQLCSRALALTTK